MNNSAIVNRERVLQGISFSLSFVLQGWIQQSRSTLSGFIKLLKVRHDGLSFSFRTSGPVCHQGQRRGETLRDAGRFLHLPKCNYPIRTVTHFLLFYLCFIICCPGAPGAKCVKNSFISVVFSQCGCQTIRNPVCQLLNCAVISLDHNCLMSKSLPYSSCKM